MKLTEENYYSKEANAHFMSVSQFKDFVGTYGRIGCEFTAINKMNEYWEEKKGSALMVGSYVDAYFEGTLDSFRRENPSIFTQKGELRAEFKKADEIIERVQKDELFMRYMSGQKQVIMTAELFGTPWKIKMDSYHEGVCIVDLKVMASITEAKWVKDLGYLDFVRYWGYDYQAAVYQKIVEICTGKKLPFYIAAVTKEEEPDIEIIQITDQYMDEALSVVEANMPRILSVKRGEAIPDRCGLCNCCRNAKVLKHPITIHDLTARI